jgi:hypothetical protein
VEPIDGPLDAVAGPLDEPATANGELIQDG